MTIFDWMKAVGAADFLDIVFMAILIYALLVLIKRTKAQFVLTGLVIFSGLYLIARQFNLFLTTAVVEAFLPVTLITLVVIFQEEIRHFFERIAVWSLERRLGRRKAVRMSRGEVETLTRTLADLARERVGALVVLRGRDLILRHLDGGVELSGRMSEPLLKSLFDPHSQGHDGAVVVDGDRVTMFSCHLPLSKNLKALDQHTGTRHAAALGLSELSDALCLVVSEERGTISAARNGQIRRLEDPESLVRLLDKFYQEVNPTLEAKPWREFFTTNSREKVVAVVLAGALWFVLSFGSEFVYRSHRLPIQVEPIPPQLAVVSVEPPAVEVTFSGRRRDLYFLKKDNLAVTAHLMQAKKGRQVIKLSGANIEFPKSLELESIAPQKIIVQIEDKPSAR